MADITQVDGHGDDVVQGSSCCHEGLLEVAENGASLSLDVVGDYLEVCVDGGLARDEDQAGRRTDLHDMAVAPGLGVP